MNCATKIRQFSDSYVKSVIVIFITTNRYFVVYTMVNAAYIIFYRHASINMFHIFVNSCFVCTAVGGPN